jgi:uncharacterized peroxidase-related enzyme
VRKPHLKLNEELPGILGPMAFRPETAIHLNQLAETLLRGPSPLPSSERELIAAYTSRSNECLFCCESHAAASRSHYGERKEVVDAVLKDLDSAPISSKLKSLLRIAKKVAKGGLNVLPEDVAEARSHGAGDVEIHDTVLIAAAFCMFNRYVDGLSTWAPPQGHPAYSGIGERLAHRGYMIPIGG